MPDGIKPAGGPRYSVPGLRPAALSARRRRRTQSVSGPVVSCPLELVRASRSGPVPPALTLSCRRPTRRPLSGSAWLQSSPNTSPGLLQGLDSLGFRAVTLPPRCRFHPVPVPIAVFGVSRHPAIVVWGPSTSRREIPTIRWHFHSGRGWCAQSDPQISILGLVGRKIPGALLG